jgi:hypothetical protein
VLEVLKNIAMLLIGSLLAVGGFVIGRSSAPRESMITNSTPITPGFIQVQNTQTQAPINPNNDARELIPLNPGGQQPGQGQQPQPGQGQQPQDCPVQIYQDGKLFTFPQPGQQPQPGQGNGNQPGRGGQPQEMIPLQPETPNNTPQPNTPGQTPAQPRAVPIQPSTPTPSTPTPENPLNPFAPTVPNTRS